MASNCEYLHSYTTPIPGDTATRPRHELATYHASLSRFLPNIVADVPASFCGILLVAHIVRDIFQDIANLLLLLGEVFDDFELPAVLEDSLYQKVAFSITTLGSLHTNTWKLVHKENKRIEDNGIPIPLLVFLSEEVERVIGSFLRLTSL